ncbi:MAG: Asp-tRNA(Asn)/Glu-tRNA(Gln) amidotransferase subunit GatC [Candidatus Nanoarchaeia archaeon]
MKINKELIQHVAETARLNLTTEEIEEFTPQIKDVLENFEKIQQINTENTEPSFQPIELRDALRDDKIQSSISQEDALKNAKHKKNGYFRGPKAI